MSTSKPSARMKQAFLFVFAISIAFTVFSSDSEPALPLHLKAARELEQNVLPENNSYRHRPSTVELKGHNGATAYVCHTDCSGLVDGLFTYAYGYTDNDFKHWLRKRRALSSSYFIGISHERGFRRIMRVQDIMPGDLLSYRLPPGSRNFGHVMIVNGAPKKLEAVDASTAAIRWAVPIIDCTGKGHGIHDSRNLGNGKYHSGIGKGEFCIYSDASGNIEGCAWSPAPGAKFYPIQTRPFVVGRLIPGFRPQ